MVAGHVSQRLSRIKQSQLGSEGKPLAVGLPFALSNEPKLIDRRPWYLVFTYRYPYKSLNHSIPTVLPPKTSSWAPLALSDRLLP